MLCIWSRLRLSIWNDVRKASSTTDRTCPGDVTTPKQVFSWIVGTGIGDQQGGNAWTAADKLVPLSMNGDLNILDKRGSTDGPMQIIRVCLHPQTTHSHCSHTAPLPLHKSGPDSNLSPTGSDEISHCIYSRPRALSTSVLMTEGSSLTQ